MFRKLLNNKLIQNYTQYLRKIENGVNISNQITKWNGQQFKAYSTAPVNKLFSLQNPKKDKELKAIQIKVKTVQYFRFDKMIKNFVSHLGCFTLRRRILRAQSQRFDARTLGAFINFTNRGIAPLLFRIY